MKQKSYSVYLYDSFLLLHTKKFWLVIFSNQPHYYFSPNWHTNCLNWINTSCLLKVKTYLINYFPNKVEYLKNNKKCHYCYLNKFHSNFAINLWCFSINFQFPIFYWKRQHFIMGHSSPNLGKNIKFINNSVFSIQYYVKYLQTESMK